MNLTMILTIVSAAAISFTVWFFGDFFLGLYTTEAAVVEIGKIRLTYIVLPLLLNGILDIFVASMRGMGYSMVPTVTMILGICGVRLTWIWTVFPLHRSLAVIYMCYPLSWTVTSIILGILWVRCHKEMLEKAKLA
jgi:Na+-driven multidrug efflux pump